MTRLAGAARGIGLAFARACAREGARVAIADIDIDGEHWDGVDAFFAKHENKAPARRSARSARPCPSGAWAPPTT